MQLLVAMVEAGVHAQPDPKAGMMLTLQMNILREPATLKNQKGTLETPKKCRLQTLVCRCRPHMVC